MLQKFLQQKGIMFYLLVIVFALILLGEIIFRLLEGQGA
jgi:hypothetical protein